MPLRREAVDGVAGPGRLAFAAPPTTSEQVIDPGRYLDGEVPLPRATVVALSDLAASR